MPNDDGNIENPEGAGLPPIGSDTVVVHIEAGPSGLKYKSNGAPEQALSIVRMVELQMMHDVFQKWTFEEAMRAQMAAQGPGGMTPIIPQ